MNYSRDWYQTPLVALTLILMCFSMAFSLTKKVCPEVCPKAQSEAQNCPACAILVDSDSTPVAYFHPSKEQRAASIILQTRPVTVPVSLEQRSRISRGPPFLFPHSR